MNKKYFAGIGARKAPKEIIEFIEDNIAKSEDLEPYVLRSGAANGCDIAFEKGFGGKKEIYIPWNGFNCRSSIKERNVTNTSNMMMYKQAESIAVSVIPHWDKLSDAAKKLQVRNVFIVLGRDLKTPVEFIMCWTRDGLVTGGTGNAIKVGRKYNIPVYNLNDLYERVI